MKMLPTLVLLAAAACQAGNASEVFRWTDEQGRVHYGDAVPEGQKRLARSVSTKAAQISDADKAAAERRAARYKGELARTADAATSLPSSASAAAFASTRPKPKKTECEAAWDAYNESYACFDPFRMAQGRVRLDAFQHCKQVNQPPGPCG